MEVWGQTLGMYVMHIKVVTIEGNPLGWGRVIWRYIAFTLSLFSIVGMYWRTPKIRKGRNKRQAHRWTTPGRAKGVPKKRPTPKGRRSLNS